MSRKKHKSKSKSALSVSSSKEKIKAVENLNNNIISSNTMVRGFKREMARILGGTVLAVSLIGLLYIAIDLNRIRTAFADTKLSQIFVEDEAQTDAEAEFIVTEEQKKLAEEYRLNPRAPEYTMKDMPQYVVFAFDGSRSLPMWRESRAFAKELNDSGIPIHFTYFINPIYLLTEEQALQRYQPPRARKGGSAIGYSDNDIDTIQRRQEIRQAQIEGHEIASHAVGHYNGVDWTLDEWRSELAQFDSIFYDGHTISKSSVQGFRAPALGQNESLFIALKERGYTYDTSMVAMAKDLPKRKDDLWEFPVATIIFGRDEKPVLSMDYSIFAHQTNAKNIAFRGSKLWTDLYDETMFSYQRYFDENYNTNHAPVYIAHHFSKWNDGLYWQVMQDFARNVCSKPNVKCVTYRELQAELEAALVLK